MDRFSVLVSQTGSRGDAAVDEAARVHSAVLGAACGGHGGEVLRDGACVVAWFASVADGLRAAVEAQSHLPFHGVETGSRMAVHARGDDLDDRGVVADAERLCAAAPSGHVLLRAATARLGADIAKDGGSFDDIGSHRLADLLPAQPLVRLRHPRLTAPDATPATLDAWPHNLPVYTTRPIGREREIADVSAALTDPAIRVVTLVGPGGIGKTRLSCHAAADAMSAFADGAWFVPLADVREPGLVATSIAQTLDVRPAANETTIDAIVRSIGSRLLVLDNFEHVLPAASLVQTIAERCPLAVVAVTSRQPLHLPAEHFVTVEALDADGVTLLADRARLADPHFVLTPAVEGTASEICRRLDGLPLAIEIAAARLKTLSPDEVLERLSLTLPLPGAPERQRTLEGAIAWSFDLLREDEQRLFSALAVFTGGWRLDDAEAVCGPIGADVAEGISALADQSLIVRDAGRDGPTRHRMLATVREFALGRLGDTDASELRARHALHFADVVGDAVPHARGQDEATWIDRLDADSANLRDALEWFEADDPSAFVRLVIDLVWFWRTRGHLSEATAWLERALRVFPDPGAERAGLVVEQGKVALSTADYPAGRDLFSVAMQMARDFAADRPLIEAIHGLATVELQLGNPDDAQALFAEELALALERRDDRSESWARIGLGIIADNRGELDAARAHYERALDIYRRSGDTRGQAVALANIAHSYDEQGDYRNALTYHEESLELNRSIGFRAGMAGDLLNLSTVLMSLGRLDEADRRAADAAAAYREIGDRGGLGAAVRALGDLALRRGDFDRARGCMLEALEVQREQEIVREVVATLGSLGDVALATGHLEDARRHYEEKLSVAHDIEYRHEEIRALLGLAAVERASGELEAAVEALDRAEELAAQIDDHAMPVAAASMRAEIARDNGDLLSSARLQQNVARAYAETGDQAALGSALRRVSWIAALTGHDATALRLHGAAEAARSSAGVAIAPDDQLEDQRYLARARARLGAREATEVTTGGRRMAIEDALREVEAVVISLAAAPQQRAAGAGGVAEFRADGDIWAISFDGSTAHVKDARGMKAIAHLLAHPGVEVHAVDVAATWRDRAPARAPASGDGLAAERLAGEPVLDSEAKEAIRSRLDDLREEAEEARAFGDDVRAARAEAEIESITDYVSKAVGLGGRDRRIGSPAERARVNVTRAIRTAIRRISELHPAAGLYLEGTIRTGTFCSYIPDPRFEVRWTL